MAAPRPIRSPAKAPARTCPGSLISAIGNLLLLLNASSICVCLPLILTARPALVKNFEGISGRYLSPKSGQTFWNGRGQRLFPAQLAELGLEFGYLRFGGGGALFGGLTGSLFCQAPGAFLQPPGALL